MNAKQFNVVVRSMSVCLGTWLVCAVATTAVAAEEYKMDGSHTAIVFRIKHLGMSYTYGRFNGVSGQFVIDTQNGGASSFSLSIRTESIDTGFQKRDDHLRSPDFFNAKQFPEITFRSTSVESVDGGYRVAGNLSLHGATKSITIDLKKMGQGEDPWGNYRMGFAADLKIKRSDFGMTNMPEAVGDQVDLMISFEGLRQGE